MKESLSQRITRLQKTIKMLHPLKNEFFSNIITTLGIPQYNETEPVSHNIDDPLMKAVMKYRFHPSIVAIKKICNSVVFFFFFFFYLGFLSRTFTIHRTAGEGEGYLFNSSLPLPPASQILRHQPGNCCRELTSAHSWQPDSDREPLVSERKSPTTKLRALTRARGCLLVSLRLRVMKL